MWSSVESGGCGRAAPSARAKHSATLVGGHVYVLGGRGARSHLPLRDFWRYSLARGTWERLGCGGEPPPALQEHTATARGHQLYVFGGEAGELSTETPLWIYDTQTEIWRKLPGDPGYSSVRRSGAGGGGGTARGAGPRGRRGHSAHALHDCLLIYGGYKDLRGSTNELWAFHYESESWQLVRTGAAGPARHRHAGALHGAALYVHGGRCDLRACADLWRYDTGARAWRPVPAAGRAPAARSGHAAARAGSHLYIFGGEADGHPADDMWRFHFGTECWERITPSLRWPSARVDSRALLVARVPGAHPVGAGAAGAGGGAAGAGCGGALVSRLRRARGSYTALADTDSTESLVRQTAAINKSHSAYVIDERAETGALPSDRASVPALLGAAGAVAAGAGADAAGADAADADAALSTSDYASAERVHAPPLAFSNPHYLWPRAALTPDSGAEDIELHELPPRAPAAPAAPAPPQLHLLLVGGREASGAAHLHAPLSMWTYRLL